MISAKCFFLWEGCFLPGKKELEEVLGECFVWRRQIKEKEEAPIIMPS